VEYIAIGTIVNTHGIHGAVTVKTDSDFKESRYRVGNRLFINTTKGRVAVTVENHGVKKSVDILMFEEYDDINAVQGFKGCVLEVAENDREPLEDDAFYASELIGLAVRVNDEVVGVVRAIRHYPQGELLVVKRQGMNDALIPFRKEFVKRVTQASIDIDPPEGLL